jgi:hypothetical protein
MARAVFKGQSLKPTDPIRLDVVYDSELTLDRVMYSLDNAPEQRYTGPFTIPEIGVHTIQFYGVTRGQLEHPEPVKHSQTLLVTATVTPEEGVVNYPNPFRAGRENTFLEYVLSQDSNITFTIYDMMGQVVYERDLAHGEAGTVAGVNRIEWDGRNKDGEVVSNGGYLLFLNIKDEGRVLKRKLAVMK